MIALVILLIVLWLMILVAGIVDRVLSRWYDQDFHPWNHEWWEE